MLLAACLPPVSYTHLNTVAVDGTDIYVCQGERGIVRYNANGEKVWDYTVPTIANQTSEKYGSVKGYCNGVAISGNYVYVAAGGYGVVVLNKMCIRDRPYVLPGVLKLLPVQGDRFASVITQGDALG